MFKFSVKSKDLPVKITDLDHLPVEDRKLAFLVALKV